MIMLMDTGNALHKIQDPFMIKKNPHTHKN